MDVSEQRQRAERHRLEAGDVLFVGPEGHGRVRDLGVELVEDLVGAFHLVAEVPPLGLVPGEQRRRSVGDGIVELQLSDAVASPEEEIEECREPEAFQLRVVVEPEFGRIDLVPGLVVLDRTRRPEEDVVAAAVRLPALPEGRAAEPVVHVVEPFVVLGPELVLRCRGVVIAFAPEGVHEGVALLLGGERQEDPSFPVGDQVGHLLGQPDAVVLREVGDLFLFAQLLLRGGRRERARRQDGGKKRERHEGPTSHGELMVVPAKRARKAGADLAERVSGGWRPEILRYSGGAPCPCDRSPDDRSSDAGPLAGYGRGPALRRC